MPAFDAEAHLKLDRLVAGQERFDEIEPVMRLILETLRVTGERITTLREMIEALMKAASQPADDGGLGGVLRGILEELQKQTGHMVILNAGLERLPGIMEDTAISAVTLATGGGVDVD